MDFAADQGELPYLMKDGDLIVAYERHDSMDHFFLEAGKILNNKFGAFHHNDFIGKPFGTKVKSRISSGWLYALKPTPDLWSLAVHTRTQIVNELDSSFVIQHLDLFPGCVVVESGTGSGCMTLALTRAVYPSGHVFTFEFNPVRAEKAKEEFVSLGVSKLVTVTCGDVCGKFDGTSGGFPGVLESTVDAVFLDLPEPWLAVGHARRVLKPGRTICTYSPCVEQVTRTCDELRAEGFLCIRMFEVRQRPFDARMIDVEQLDLGSKDVPTDDGVVAIESAEASSSIDDPDRKRKIDQVDQTETSGAMEITGESADSNGGSSSASVKGYSARFVPKPVTRRLVPVARPITSMKGHTAFLTFAFAPPAKFEQSPPK